LSGWGVVSLLYLLACALQYRYLNNNCVERIDALNALMQCRRLRKSPRRKLPAVVASRQPLHALHSPAVDDAGRLRLLLLPSVIMTGDGYHRYRVRPGNSFIPL
jgi:hypothetical protein